MSIWKAVVAYLVFVLGLAIVLGVFLEKEKKIERTKEITSENEINYFVVIEGDTVTVGELLQENGELDYNIQHLLAENIKLANENDSLVQKKYIDSVTINDVKRDGLMFKRRGD